MPRSVVVRLAFALVLGVGLASIPDPARAEIEDEGTFWTGYMSSWWLDDRWGLWFDTHYNVDSFFVLRGGVSRRFEAGPTVTGGYAWLRLNPDMERNEHRPWGQIFWPYKFDDRWSISGRLRLDLRFQESLEDGEIVDGYDFAFRPRFQTTLTRRLAPLSWGQPLVQLSHEILLNAASSDDRDVLDQNRVSLLLGVEMAAVTIRVGYMHRYLPWARSGNGLSEHAALVWFTQSMDLRERRLEKEDEPEIGGP